MDRVRRLAGTRLDILYTYTYTYIYILIYVNIIYIDMTYTYMWVKSSCLQIGMVVVPSLIQ